MQRTWLMKTKVLFIAAIALLTVVEISSARPEGRGRLLGRRNQSTTDNTVQTQPVTVAQAAPVDQQPPVAQNVPQDQQPAAQVPQQQPQQQPIVQNGNMVPQEQVIGRGRRARTVTNYVPASQVQAQQPGNMTRQAFYPANTSAPVIIDMRIPASAEVWFGDAKTNQTGMFRQFISPNLEPQKNYVYEVKAKWMENGQPVEKTRQVNVVAGNRVVVDFNTAQ